MKKTRIKYLTKFLKFFGLLIIIVLIVRTYNGSSAQIDYNADVKPILNQHCISCHGGVKQSNGFSLLSRTDALAPTDSGKPAIIPGLPDSSEFIHRILSNDPDERMPYEKEALSGEEIGILKKWVKQGAEWGIHWAYRPVQNPLGASNDISMMSAGAVSPDVDQSFIDDYVLQKLKSVGLSMNPEASRPELLRRVSYDLTGIPASDDLVKRFVVDQSIGFEEVVNELLNNQSYGEKWASMWLDIARYADSKGFERDQNRSIWAYRDYVIRSLNSDLPYDQFIIEQIAGDLLDHPTDDQLIATGFHRNTTTNDEGGTDNEEFRIKAVMDRVNTTWEGLLGTTMACVQCHGHPYDPFPHETYYQSFAFLNNTRDADTHPDYPRLNFLDSSSQKKLKELTNWVAEQTTSEKADEIEQFVKVVQPVIYSLEMDDFDNSELYDTKYLGLRKNGWARIPHVDLEEKTVLLIRGVGSRTGGQLSLHLDGPGGLVIGTKNIPKTKGYHIIEIPLAETEGTHDIYVHYKNSSLESRDIPGLMIDWLYFTSAFPGANKQGHRRNKDFFYELISRHHDHTLIMTENPPERQRKTHVFDRGNWLIKSLEVQPNVPKVLPQIETKNQVPRLAFAEWIADEGNPLTARTFVNRIWEQLFGRGIALTTEDLGSQGSPPSHLELLDHLSYFWMHDQDWSIKELLKAIILSKTYRQSSYISENALIKDPDNIFLSRGPRVRLSAEQVRDQALSISGLLSTKMYGPPVMPFQPEDVWQTPYNAQKWSMSPGEDQYRRAIYTMMKRSSLYPSMETFDLSGRQVCVSRRIRTNTPLQALVTLNDPVFVEASEHLAKKMMEEGGKDISDQIAFAYCQGMHKEISPGKLDIMINLFKTTMNELQSENDSELSLNRELAMTTVANAILNLDEFLNK